MPNYSMPNYGDDNKICDIEEIIVEGMHNRLINYLICWWQLLNIIQSSLTGTSDKLYS